MDDNPEFGKARNAVAIDKNHRKLKSLKLKKNSPLYYPVCLKSSENQYALIKLSAGMPKTSCNFLIILKLSFLLPLIISD